MGKQGEEVREEGGRRNSCVIVTFKLCQTGCHNINELNL